MGSATRQVASDLTGRWGSWTMILNGSDAKAGQFYDTALMKAHNELQFAVLAIAKFDVTWQEDREPQRVYLLLCADRDYFPFVLKGYGMEEDEGLPYQVYHTVKRRTAAAITSFGRLLPAALAPSVAPPLAAPSLDDVWVAKGVSRQARTNFACDKERR